MTSATTPPSGDPSTPETKTALVGVDWGTSSLRAYRLGRDGRLLERVRSEQGILQVEDDAFAETLDAIVGAWREPGLPVILSGMIGSRQGWLEVPYLDIPTKLDAIAGALARHPDDPTIHIVPGLAQDPEGQAPDVMRGEETQIIGALGDETGSCLLIMPGTHSKWVLVDQGKITWFATFMTGEMFSLLTNHSILGRLMVETDDAHDAAAFELGLDGAKRLPGGLLQKLFSARTLPLFERLPADSIATYLSGLLIGSEIQEGLSNLERSDNKPSITIIGASNLAERYLDAIAHQGINAKRAGDDAAAYGHYQLARNAHLIAT